MKLDNIRAITIKELDQMNEKIIPRFGTQNQITSGSCVKLDGKRLYNIAFDGAIPKYKSLAMIERIAQTVKEILKADEVYYCGIKLT